MAATSAPLYAPLIPSLAQAYQYDPRRLVAESLLAQGAKAVQAPAYNPLSALAHALTEGIGGLSSAHISNQYQDMNRQALSDFQNAEQAGAGSPGVADASGNVVTPPTQPNPQATLAALSKSPYWAPTIAGATVQAAEKQLEPYTLSTPGAERYGPGGALLARNNAPMSPEGKLLSDINNTPPDQRTALQAVLWKSAQENGVVFGPNGAVAFPGAPQAKAAIAGPTAAAEANAKNQSDLAYKPEIAGATAKATVGPDILKEAAGYALRPVSATPTERVVSGFSALPTNIQGLITDATSKVFPEIGQSAGKVAPTVGKSLLAPAQSNPATPPAIEGNAIPAQMTQAQYEAESKLGQDFATTDKKAYDSANQGLMSLYQMNAAANKLASTGGWATPGAALDMRADFAKQVNTWQQAFGFKPSFDPSTVSSWELMAKETKRAGMQLVNQMFGGSREAASIINGATAAVPNSENTYLGYRLVSSSVEQSLQRERELYQFKAQRVAEGKPLATAEIDFNKANPPQQYVDRAIANAVPDPAVNLLMQNKGNPQYIQQFDQKYGHGLAAFILGGGRTGMGAAGR